MQRHHSHSDHRSMNQLELLRQVAFHEAGHAVAIYLRNKQQSLPPVFFQISLGTYERNGMQCGALAHMEGGRLIEHLPYSLEYLSAEDQLLYVAAFEADIINLLIGPLAEAKYVALRDGESINQQLVDLSALSFYGGAADLEIVEDYIRCFVDTLQQRRDKIEALFAAAYRFIERPLYWFVISALARHILETAKQEISCVEISTVIEQAVAEFTANEEFLPLKRPLNAYVERGWF